MAFQKIPVTGDVDAALLNRVQQNIADEFTSLENPNSLVTPVVITARLTSYTVQSSDKYIAVDASAGPGTIALPPPGNQQAVTVVKVDGSANAVTVKRSDGEALSDGSSSVDAAPSVQLLNTGKTWAKL